MPSFSITSFNARWGLNSANEPFGLPAVVASFGSDVISVQEVWDPSDGPPALHQMASEHGYELVEVPLSGSTLEGYPQITVDPAQITGTWGVALLSRLPVRRVRVVDLGRLVERWDVAHRQAIIADIDVGGYEVSIAAIHLSFVPPNAAAQLRRLGGYLPKGRPSVVAGDCNLWGPLARAALVDHERAVRGRTWPADRPHSQLDHILISSGLAVEDAKVMASVGSDHLPVTATLRVV